LTVKKMKINKVALILLICIVAILMYIAYDAKSAKVNLSYNNASWSSLSLKDQNSILQNSLFNILSPYIFEQIQSYYNDKFVNYTFEKIVSINANDGFELTISFSTFKGSHNFIGNDSIIVNIKSGTVKILGFTHKPI